MATVGDLYREFVRALPQRLCGREAPVCATDCGQTKVGIAIEHMQVHAWGQCRAELSLQRGCGVVGRSTLLQRAGIRFPYVIGHRHQRGHLGRGAKRDCAGTGLADQARCIGGGGRQGCAVGQRR